MNSVVVVGAGFAGLSCAWKLRRVGHEVEVLEAACMHPGDTGAVTRDADEPNEPLVPSFDRSAERTVVTHRLLPVVRVCMASQSGALEKVGEPIG